MRCQVTINWHNNLTFPPGSVGFLSRVLCHFLKSSWYSTLPSDGNFKFKAPLVDQETRYKLSYIIYISLHWVALTVALRMTCFPFQYFRIPKYCRVLIMSLGWSAVSWLMSKQIERSIVKWLALNSKLTYIFLILNVHIIVGSFRSCEMVFITIMVWFWTSAFSMTTTSYLALFLVGHKQ